MRAFSLFVATAAVGALVMPATAEPTKWSQAGTLDCTMGPSIGLVIGNRQQARCVFTSAQMATDWTNSVAPEAQVNPSFPYFSSAIGLQTDYILRKLARTLHAAGSGLERAERRSFTGEKRWQ